jgi:hypothetical protein
VRARGLERPLVHLHLAPLGDDAQICLRCGDADLLSDVGRRKPGDLDLIAGLRRRRPPGRREHRHAEVRRQRGLIARLNDDAFESPRGVDDAVDECRAHIRPRGRPSLLQQSFGAKHRLRRRRDRRIVRQRPRHRFFQRYPLDRLNHLRRLLLLLRRLRLRRLGWLLRKNRRCPHH